MIKRIAAITFIFVCTSVGWAILGATIFARTYSSDATSEGRVASTWGVAQNQSPPGAFFEQVNVKNEESTEGGKKIVHKVEEKTYVPLELENSRVNVDLNLEHRQKGLLWYSTYKVAFAGTYTFHNASDKDQVVTFDLAFPAAQAVYDDLVFTVDDVPVAITNQKGAAKGMARVGGGKNATLRVGYKSQGLKEWRYSFARNQDVTQVRDFGLQMTTNFKDIDFPDATLSPTEKRETADGWKLNWAYKNVLSGYQIAMTMPEKLQPGPLAGMISFFAPVSLFFFFFLMFIITTMRGIELHPMNYFFLATSFFAFHLLLAYLVDHISIHWSFAISAVVSLALVISYMRLVTGPRFALVECGLAQLVYLVLFSYAFFFKGYTGLAVTIGSIVTLFAVMQMTGRINWSERFARAPAAPPPVPVR